MTQQIEVVGAVLVRDGTVLAARRGPAMALAGLWEFPGGKIEHGESPQQALSREVRRRISVALGQPSVVVDLRLERLSFEPTDPNVMNAEMRAPVPSNVPAMAVPRASPRSESAMRRTPQAPTMPTAMASTPRNMSSCYALLLRGSAPGTWLRLNPLVDTHQADNTCERLASNRQ